MYGGFDKYCYCLHLNLECLDIEHETKYLYYLIHITIVQCNFCRGIANSLYFFYIGLNNSNNIHTDSTFVQHTMMMYRCNVNIPYFFATFLKDLQSPNL
jgi:hypothetical protein